VFILSSVRSGSTLLRCLLNSHPDLCAPSELHLRHLRVTLDDEYAERAMAAIGYSVAELEHLLWDRLLHNLLTASGKQIIVDKSPSNVRIWRRLQQCWPQARYIVLRRHPGAIVDSIVRADDGRDEAIATEQVAWFVTELDAASATLDEVTTLTYEELTAAPAATCRRLCDFLGVTWDPAMLHYGRHDHGPFTYGIGDWSINIRSGRVQRASPPPATISPELVALCHRWGYESPRPA
jgi:hypothetical protein